MTVLDSPAAVRDSAATAAVPARSTSRITDLAADVHYTDLPDRDLDQTELMSLASSVAADRGRWQGDVAFDDEHRHYVCLHRDTHVDIWMLCWTPANDTGWHDHDVSSGAVAVVQGSLLEHNLAVGSPSVETVVEAGDVFSFGPSHIHRLTGVGAGSVSVHAYSPPLWRLGQYEVGPCGVLRRTSVSYADELRPIPMSPSDSPSTQPIFPLINRPELSNIDRSGLLINAGQAPQTEAETEAAR